MPIEPQWLIIGGVAALLGAGALVARAAERKRREAYEQHCLIRGFKFEPERPEGERRLREFFEQFNQGRSRRWGYTISGQLHGAAFTAFEYRWVTGGGRSSQTHHIGCVLWELDDAVLPQFSLTPEGWLSRLGQVFGMQDIDFDDAPEFSKAYRLKGPDETAIRTLFTPEIRQFFAVTLGQQVAGGGRFLMWWRDGRLSKAEQLDEWLELGDQVRRRFFKR